MKTSEQRKSLRRQLLKARKSLPRWKRQQAESRILSQGLSLVSPHKHQRIAGYLATGSEANITDLLYLLNLDGHEIYLPQINPSIASNNAMRFRRWMPAAKLHRNKHGIPEPWLGPTCAPERLDLAFLPLVGWDTSGNRLGTGGGYYDRCFEFRLTQPQKKHPVLCGVGFRCQQMDTIPSEEWDVPLDYLLSG